MRHVHRNRLGESSGPWTSQGGELSDRVRVLSDLVQVPPVRAAQEFPVGDSRARGSRRVELQIAGCRGGRHSSKSPSRR